MIQIKELEIFPVALLVMQCWRTDRSAISLNHKNLSVATCKWKVMSVMQDYWVQQTMMLAVMRTASCVTTRELCALTRTPCGARIASLCQGR
jgi:hypothetical protein